MLTALGGCAHTGWLASEERARREYERIRLVNDLLGSARAARGFLEAELAVANGRPLRVLDIGSGVCDLPLALGRWARGRGLDIRFTCVESSRAAFRLAEPNLASGGAAIELVQEDIFRHRPAQPYDCAIGNLFFRTLSGPGILTLAEHLRRIVRRSVLIHDLRRGLRAGDVQTLLRSVPGAIVQARPRLSPGVLAVLTFLP